jgi:hypothetical protein
LRVYIYAQKHREHRLKNFLIHKISFL